MHALIKLAHENPQVARDFWPLLKAARGKAFDEYVKGKKFKNPNTGNMVVFDSLPKEKQEKIREFYREKNRPDEDEEKVQSKIEEYNLEIVGNNKKRAEYVAKKIVEGISKNEDICDTTPPVCKGNLGISRKNMPQIMDSTVKKLLNSSDPGERKKGEAAVKAGADPKSDKTIMEHLLEDLKKEGVSVESDQVAVKDLRATQREIKAGKSFGMADSYLKGSFDPASDVEIIISNDGHILDGHHRWASLLLSDPDRKMKVKRVDLTMKDFLKRSFEQPGVFRADLQDNIIGEDEPLDLGDGPIKIKKKKASRMVHLHKQRQGSLRGDIHR